MLNLKVYLLQYEEQIEGGVSRVQMYEEYLDVIVIVYLNQEDQEGVGNVEKLLDLRFSLKVKVTGLELDGIWDWRKSEELRGSFLTFV